MLQEFGTTPSFTTASGALDHSNGGAHKLPQIAMVIKERVKQIVGQYEA